MCAMIEKLRIRSMNSRARANGALYRRTGPASVAAVGPGATRSARSPAASVERGEPVRDARAVEGIAGKLGLAVGEHGNAHAVAALEPRVVADVDDLDGDRAA